MAKFINHRTKGYTVMSNYHLRDRELSLKAKGLLSVMLSLPDTWDYSVSGLMNVVGEGERSVTSALKELKERGYLVVVKLTADKTESKHLEYEYNIYEEPQNQGVQNQGTQNQGVQNVCLDNAGQIITNRITTKEINTKEIINDNNNPPLPPLEVGETKTKFGDYVSMTTVEYQKLSEEFGEDVTNEMIEILNNYKGSSGKKYKSDYMAIRSWVIDRWKEKHRESRPAMKSFKQQEHDDFMSYVEEMAQKGSYVP